MISEHQKSENGITVYSYQNPAAHGFFLSLFARGGSLYESERESGISHFVEHVAIRNVHRLMEGELYALLDREGLEFNASTYSDMLQFYISGAREKLPIACKILPRLLSPLVLSSEEVELERRRIRAEIREGDDRTSLGTFTAKLLYPNHPLSRPILGTGSSIARISLRALEGWRRRLFAKESFFFFLTGNYRDADTDLLLEEACEHYREGAEPLSLSLSRPPAFGRRGGVFLKNADFTMLRFSFDLDMKKITIPEADILYDVLLAGYNSPFFIEMSENRGLFYDLNGSVERYPDLGLLYFTYEVKEKDLLAALSLTLRLLARTKEVCFSEGEMMKASYVDNAYMLYDDARELNFTMAYDAHILGLGYTSLEERIEAYRSVTPERLREVARTVFRTGNLTLTVKGNKKKIDLEAVREMLALLDK